MENKTDTLQKRFDEGSKQMRKRGANGTFLRALAGFLAVLFLCCACGEAAQPGETESERQDPDTGAPIQTETETEQEENDVKGIDLEKLRQTGEDSQRWLSVPFSRLVVNPYEFSSGSEVTHADYADRATLPLNIGYLDPYTTSGTGIWLEDLLSFYEISDEGVNTAVYLASDMSSVSGWSKTGGSYTDFSTDGTAFHVTVRTGADVPWQYVGHIVEMDLDASPQVTVTVDRCEGKWALKFCPTGEADIVIASDNSKTGTFTYDLARAIGRTGKIRGTIKLFSIGYDKELVARALDIRSVQGGYAQAESFSTAWTPSALEFSASYPEGLAVSGFDTFSDEETVVRTLRIEKEGRLAVAVRTGFDCSERDGIIRVDAGTYRYALASDGGPVTVYYPSMADLRCDTRPSEDPEDSAFALLDFGLCRAGETVTLAFSLTSDVEDAGVCLGQAGAAAKAGTGEAARKERDAYWTDFLSRVPHPENFKLSVVSKNVTPEQIEHYYYIAWIFTAQDILPANPELDYPYPQLACGKPSMWAYGDPQSAYSASWESFFGIQLMGYVMPDVAWDALTGLISLVDEDGMLGGESLPSEKAHSAWLLYQLTGDRERLEALYDGIGRYLDWRMENPRWIYLEHNDVNSADADFVVSALVDVDYMIRICDILEKPADKTAWLNKYDAFLAKYLEWNFDKSGNVYQYCDKVTMQRRPGCRLWSTKGLMVEGLDEKYQGYLYRAFTAEYNVTASFAGFSGVKYPEIAGNVLGLAKTGHEREALRLAECCARDIVRVGMLSENYTNDADPQPTGVRPAMFGAALMIDCVLLMNGFSFQQASEVSFAVKGGVSDIWVRGEKLTVTID